MSNESSVAKGFGVTCGVILAIMFVVGGLATVAVVGCVGTAVVGTGAAAKVASDVEAARAKARAKIEADKAAQKSGEQETRAEAVEANGKE